MRETPRFYGIRITPYLTVDYIRGLFVVYCLGVALRVRPPVVKVYSFRLFSTAVVYLSKIGEKLTRVALLCSLGSCEGQKKGLFCVHHWRADPAKHSRSRTRCWQKPNAPNQACTYIRVRCLTSAPNNFTAVYGNISRMRKQCISGPPFFWEGPEYEANHQCDINAIRYVHNSHYGFNIEMGIIIS